MICYTPEGLLSDAAATQKLAQAEGLWAHALSVGIRRRLAEGSDPDVSAAGSLAWPEALPEPAGVPLPGFERRA